MISFDSTKTSTGSYTSSLIDEFTLGDKKRSPKIMTNYVCHLSTIPFCTTFDLDYERKILKNNDFFQKEYHGPSYKHKGSCTCNANYCMFVNSKKEYYDNYISPTCPCGEFSSKEEKLTPICFLSFLKTTSHNLVESKKTLCPEEVLFCPDARSILDNKYPALIAEKLNVSGYGRITKPKLIPLMEKLYWFRKYNKKYNLAKEMIKIMQLKPYSAFLQDWKQTLHSINGLLIKKFMAFGPECVSYKVLAEQTALLYRDFILDYGSGSRSEIPLYAQGSIFEDCKKFFNYVKENHEHHDYEYRVSILDYQFENRSLGRFFGQEFMRLKKRINARVNQGLGDYTQTLAWDYRCVETCQTRNLGYLPAWKARENDLAWRKKVDREPEPITQETDNLIREAVRQELRLGGVPPDMLSGEKAVTDKLVNESVLLELKYAASARTNVSAGGKPEDARQLIHLIRKKQMDLSNKRFGHKCSHRYDSVNRQTCRE